MTLLPKNKLALIDISRVLGYKIRSMEMACPSMRQRICQIRQLDLNIWMDEMVTKGFDVSFQGLLVIGRED